MTPKEALDMIAAASLTQDAPQALFDAVHLITQGVYTAQLVLDQVSVAELHQVSGSPLAECEALYRFINPK